MSLPKSSQVTPYGDTRAVMICKTVGSAVLVAVAGEPIVPSLRGYDLRSQPWLVGFW
jgi:hypothetical protein